MTEPRPPAVAGLFYPGHPGGLREMVDGLVEAAAQAFPTPADVDAGRLAGILVPHAGLVYSGALAAAAWAVALRAGGTAPPATVLLLGTNHGAAWLTGVGTWDHGPWQTPLGDVPIDRDLLGAVLELGPPFEADPGCHAGEHSIEVQLPFLARLAPGTPIVACSVGTGTGGPAIRAGERLGAMLAERRAAGARILLAISSDMAHYPADGVAREVTAALLPAILGVSPDVVAVTEGGLMRQRRGVSCGMCGIEPTVLGLAALRAMGVRRGVALASATSADAGGDPGRTVGYLAVAFAEG